MKRTPPFKAKNVTDFLVARGWLSFQKSSGRLRILRPPPELNLPEGFAITVPATDTSSDSVEVLAKIVDTVAEIYDLTKQQLETVFRSADTILSVQFEDETTRFGAIPF